MGPVVGAQLARERLELGGGSLERLHLGAHLRLELGEVGAPLVQRDDCLLDALGVAAAPLGLPLQLLHLLVRVVALAAQRLQRLLALVIVLHARHLRLHRDTEGAEGGDEGAQRCPQRAARRRVRGLAQREGV